MAALGWLQNLGFAGSGVGAAAFQACWADDDYTLVYGMKKNVASQVIGVQMITAADGTAFTGSTAVAVTGDGGAQGAGGGTGPTHEGNGFFTYIPTQAETNYDHIGFTFTGTGAIPKTVQVYTHFPQTGDAFARIGAAGAALTDLGGMSTTMKAQVQTEAEDALVTHRLDELLNADSDIDGAAPPTVGSVFHELLSKTAGSFTFDQTTDSLEALRDRGDAAWITIPAADIRTAVGLAAANLDTQLTAIDDFLDTEVAAIKAQTDKLTFTVANQVDANVQYVNDVLVAGTGAPGDEWGP